MGNCAPDIGHYVATGPFTMYYSGDGGIHTKGVGPDGFNFNASRVSNLYKNSIYQIFGDAISMNIWIKSKLITYIS